MYSYFKKYHFVIKIVSHSLKIYQQKPSHIKGNYAGVEG